MREGVVGIGRDAQPDERRRPHIGRPDPRAVIGAGVDAASTGRAVGIADGDTATIAPAQLLGARRHRRQQPGTLDDEPVTPVGEVDQAVLGRVARIEPNLGVLGTGLEAAIAIRVERGAVVLQEEAEHATLDLAEPGLAIAEIEAGAVEVLARPADAVEQRVVDRARRGQAVDVAGDLVRPHQLHATGRQEDGLGVDGGGLDGDPVIAARGVDDDVEPVIGGQDQVALERGRAGDDQPAALRRGRAGRPVGRADIGRRPTAEAAIPGRP